jgi:hypothetical protein
MSIKLSVIGSRSFENEFLLHDTLGSLNVSIELIISGGAKGADKFAEKWAIQNRIPFKPILPQWDKFGKAAGIKRNRIIVEEADFCLIFWDGKSRGTKSTIDFCEKLKKPFKLVLFEN